MKRINGFARFAIVVLLSYFAIAPLFVPGFFPMHDDTQVGRVYEMARAVMDGMFPVRWVVDLGYGYGYPIFTFYGPFAYYFASVPVILGANALLATKIMFVAGILLSGVGMYYLARIFWGSAGGIVAALLYIYAPYHAVTIYVRGAVGEFYGYAMLPFVFYGLIKTYKDGRFRYFALLAISLAILISSHNLTALMLSPFLLCSVVILMILALRKKSLRTFYLLFFGLILGIALSAFYWLPALLEMKYTNVLSQIGGGADFRDHFVCISQLWSSPWGYAGSARGCIDGISFQIGKLHNLLVVLSLPLLFLFRRLRDKQLVVGACLVFLMMALFLLLPSSQFVWEALPQLAFIQYPWRFLMFVTFFSSFLGGGVVWYVVSREKVRTISFARILIVGICVLSLIIYYAKLFRPQVIIPVTSSYYTGINDLRWKTSKISDEYMPQNFQKPQNESEFPLTTFSTQGGDALILHQISASKRYAADYRSKVPSIMYARIAPFPGWHASVDGKPTKLMKQNDGYLISTPAGRHLLTVNYQETSVELASDLVSLIGILVLLTGIIVTERRGSL